MYVFGIDIPLVELLLGLSIIGALILIEIAIILILITFHMKNSKRLEGQIANLSSALTRLKGTEIKEISKLQELSSKGEKAIKNLKVKPEKRKFYFESPKLYKKPEVKQERNGKLLKKVDKFLRRK